MKIEITHPQVATIRVRFVKTLQSHGSVEKGPGQTTINTTCHISVEYKKSFPLLQSVLAEARQNPKDKYSKYWGKKIALTRAIAKGPSTLFTREVRKAIHNEFEKEFNHLFDGKIRSK